MLMLTHRHNRDQNIGQLTRWSKDAPLYAVWRGYDSPLRGLDATASCANGDDRIYWTVDAENVREALRQLPPYHAGRTQVSEVRRAPIR